VQHTSSLDRARSSAPVEIGDLNIAGFQVAFVLRMQLISPSPFTLFATISSCPAAAANHDRAVIF